MINKMTTYSKEMSCFTTCFQEPRLVCLKVLVLVYWKKWTRIAILHSVYIPEKRVCQIISLNATNQIVTSAKMYQVDTKYG